LATRARLEYAEQWKATVDSQPGREQEKAAARAEISRCQQDCLAAARQNLDAWNVAAVREKDIVWRAETRRGRDFSKPVSASYDTKEIKECEAGVKDAEKMLASVREEAAVQAPVQAA